MAHGSYLGSVQRGENPLVVSGNRFVNKSPARRERMGGDSLAFALAKRCAVHVYGPIYNAFNAAICVRVEKEYRISVRRVHVRIHKALRVCPMAMGRVCAVTRVDSLVGLKLTRRAQSFVFVGFVDAVVALERLSLTHTLGLRPFVLSTSSQPQISVCVCMCVRA